MSHEDSSATPTPDPAPAAPSEPTDLHRAALGRRLLGAWQLIVSVALAAGVLCWLLFGSGTHRTGPASHEQKEKDNSANHVVEIVGPNVLRLKSDSVLAQKIEK